jgi:hypothetical protein
VLPDVVVPAEAVAGASDPILDLTGCGPGAAPAYAPIPPGTRHTDYSYPSPQSPDRRPGRHTRSRAGGRRAEDALASAGFFPVC